MSLLTKLQQFQLSENEARVYLASLECGPGSVQKIAKTASLNRVTVYGIVESLIAKGFLHEIFDKNKKYIAAYSPTKLYDVLTHRENELKKERNLLDSLVPQLKMRSSGKHSSNTNIIYYEGEEGLKNWASDALETQGELLEWTKIESYSKKFDQYLHDYYYPEKFKRSIPTRFIFLDTPDARTYVTRYTENPKASPMKARFIPEEQFNTPGFMVVYNDRFSVALPNEMRAVTVIDPLIADTQRQIFEFGWIHARDEVAHGIYPNSKML